MSSETALAALVEDEELFLQDAHVELSRDVEFLFAQVRGPRLRALHAVTALSCSSTSRESIAERLRAFEAHDDRLVARHTRWARSRLGARPFVQPPLFPESERPLPYFGEHVRFFSEPATSRGARDAYEADVWLAAVADVIETGPYEDDVEAFEREALERLELWTPDVLVLARTKATLVIYDGANETEVERVITSDDPAGFRMGALMHQVQLEYDDAANANDRIFEGLRRVRDGVFRVVTGS